MGGSETSRGIVYQGMTSVLQALGQNEWNKITVEYPTGMDKVDIGLEAEYGSVIKSIQVKSTINTFKKKMVAGWIKDLTEDVEAQEYQIVLIGNCDDDVVKIKKQLDIYYANQLTEKKELSKLACIEEKVLSKGIISIEILPFKLEYLQDILISKLHKYLSEKENVIDFDSLQHISGSLITDQLFTAITGKGMPKDAFDENLNKQVMKTVRQYRKKRVRIGIRSISNEREDMQEDTEKMLCLLDLFDSRFLKDEYEWNRDIISKVKQFLIDFNGSEKYAIEFDAHFSIAFTAGRILNSKFGIDAMPVQKTMGQGKVLWEAAHTERDSYTPVEIKREHINDGGPNMDVVLIVNITKNIRDDVKAYIKEEGILAGQVINCQLKGSETSSSVIADGTHAYKIASWVAAAVDERSSKEKRNGCLHIFVAAPVGLVFFLGQYSHGFRECIFYEYDFENKGTGSYLPSVSFPNEFC